MNDNKMIIGVDPGELESGMVVIRNGKILKAIIVSNTLLIGEIQAIRGDNELTVVYEDIRNPYIGMRAQAITTCKFIGVMEFLLRQMDGVTIHGIERVRVRKWVYDNFPILATARVKERIRHLDDQGARLDRKRYLKKDGSTLRDPSFHFVNDRIVVAAMRSRWRIPVPKPGKTNRHGLKSHSWQALAVATAWSCCQQLAEYKKKEKKKRQKQPIS